MVNHIENMKKEAARISAALDRHPLNTDVRDHYRSAMASSTHGSQVYHLTMLDHLVDIVLPNYELHQI
jgi:hypothetical protein